MKSTAIIVAGLFALLSAAPANAELFIDGKADDKKQEVRVGISFLGKAQPEHMRFANLEDAAKPFYKKKGFWLLSILAVVAVVVGENNDWGQSSGDNRGNLSSADTDNRDLRSASIDLKNVEVGDDLTIILYSFSDIAAEQD